MEQPLLCNTTKACAAKQKRAACHCQQMLAGNTALTSSRTLVSTTRVVYDPNCTSLLMQISRYSTSEAISSR